MGGKERLFTTVNRQRHFYVLIVLLSLILSRPFLPDQFLDLATILLLVLTTLLCSAQRLARTLTLVLGFPSVTLVILGIATPSLFQETFGQSVFNILIGSLFLLCLLSSGLILRSLLESRRVESDTIFGAVNLYIIIGITFAIVHYTAYLYDPNSFTLPDVIETRSGAESMFTEFLYFSFITLSTQGYGDITPCIPLSQMLVVVETIIGQFYMAVIVAYLLSFFIRKMTHAETSAGRNADPSLSDSD
jgi:hypothetical protein